MNAKQKLLVNLAAASFLLGGPYGYDDVRHSAPTRCKNVDEIAGYHHEGIYSKQKKLRKGAGHKKLTRAQRKKMKGGK